jgi:hypothetical protein
MPLEYTRNDIQRRITVISSGEVTLAEALAVIERQAAEGAWSYGVLYDTRASAHAPTPADVHRVLLRVGALTARHGPRGPVAFVVCDPALTKMGRRYARLGDLTALDVRLFAAVADAERWLEGEN